MDPWLGPLAWLVAELGRLQAWLEFGMDPELGPLETGPNPEPDPEPDPEPGELELEHYPEQEAP